jgi:prefoldin subunit 5
MGCKKMFDRAFLADNCTAVFITKDLKKHRENVLLDREKSLLIETQPYVVIERERQKLCKKASEIALEKDELMKRVRELDQVIYEIQNQAHHLSGTIPNVEERKKFIRKCPMNDCRGFLSTQWKCGNCDSKICNKCNELKEDTHECIPENVASMELLNKDSKPCPECATIIFKISGCSQMFCTNCNTPWDWNTGRKVSGVIHNPHYYQFIGNGGQIGRNHADIPCGGLPDLREIRRFLEKIRIHNTEIGEIFWNVHNIINHINHHELRVPIVDTVAFNRKLRVKYIMNDLDEKEFKNILQANEKQREKKEDFHNIYRMFVDVASDIYRQMMTNGTYSFAIEQVDIIKNLIEYFNTNLKKIGKTYNVVYPGITQKYSWTSNLKKQQVV